MELYIWTFLKQCILVVVDVMELLWAYLILMYLMVLISWRIEFMGHHDTQFIFICGNIFSLRMGIWDFRNHFCLISKKKNHFLFHAFTYIYYIFLGIFFFKKNRVETISHFGTG